MSQLRQRQHEAELGARAAVTRVTERLARSHGRLGGVEGALRRQEGVEQRLDRLEGESSKQIEEIKRKLSKLTTKQKDDTIASQKDQVELLDLAQRVELLATLSARTAIATSEIETEVGRLQALINSADERLPIGKGRYRALASEAAIENSQQATAKLVHEATMASERLGILPIHLLTICSTIR
eukprot:SAG31_NODE_2086_length_6484_cov_23.518716_2_plen_184_part_00